MNNQFFNVDSLITGGWRLHPGQVQPDGAKWAGSPLPPGPRHDPGSWTRSVYYAYIFSNIVKH